MRTRKSSTLPTNEPIVDEWLGSTQRYEGLPLALRVRPLADSPEHRARWPHFAAVTHVLAQVRGDGLPEPAYNETLDAFDAAVIHKLDAGVRA